MYEELKYTVCAVCSRGLLLSRCSLLALSLQPCGCMCGAVAAFWFSLDCWRSVAVFIGRDVDVDSSLSGWHAAIETRVVLGCALSLRTCT